MTFLYFGYGSNMLIERLRARCEGVELDGPAVADGYALDFSKRSDDGSGKATLRKAPGKCSCGVLFKIPEDQEGTLDGYEGKGKGYDRKPIDVRRDDGQTVRAECYFGTDLCDKRKPYDWYLALVIAGALQNGLDERYVEFLRNFKYLDDPNSKRPRRKKAVRALKCAGYPNYRDLLRG